MSTKRSVDDAAVQVLKKALSNTDAEVLGPKDEGYPASIERWSRAAEKPAGVSILPTSAEQIAIAVRYASTNNLDLAVKGGGHSTAGASSTHGGVMISLSRMRKVRVDPEKKLLYVQGGCLWSDVDAAAWEHGLATVGGTVGDTGVGGLALGGGYGHLTGKYGLTIDNIVEITLVVASGEIITASKKENPDLYWACLGAGQNFGVVVEFVLKAYEQSEVYCGTLVFPPTPHLIDQLVAANNDLYEVKDTSLGPHAKAAGRCSSSMALARPPAAGGHTMVLVLIAFLGTESEAKEVLKPFFEIGPVFNDMTTRPFPQVNDLIPAIIGMRSSMKGAAFHLPLRPSFVADVVSKYDAFTTSLPDAGASLIIFEMYDTTKVNELDAGAFANRGYHLNGLVMPSWGSSENDVVCRQWARDMSNMFKTEMDLRGGAGRRGHKGGVMLYGNYDQYDERSRDIFGENYARLQGIKKRYDPGNLFDKLFAIQAA